MHLTRFREQSFATKKYENGGRTFREYMRLYSYSDHMLFFLSFSGGSPCSHVEHLLIFSSCSVRIVAGCRMRDRSLIPAPRITIIFLRSLRGSRSRLFISWAKSKIRRSLIDRAYPYRLSWFFLTIKTGFMLFIDPF